jgi:hypothetical protein
MSDVTQKKSPNQVGRVWGKIVTIGGIIRRYKEGDVCVRLVEGEKKQRMQMQTHRNPNLNEIHIL